MSGGSRTLLAACIAAAASVASAQAQEHPASAGFALGLNGAYVDLGAEDLDDLKSGFGVQATGRYTWDSAFQLVVGAQYSAHDISDAAGDARFLVIFADPRYVIRLYSSERVAPFLGGRLGYVRQSLSGGGLDGSANGMVAGLSAGFIWEFSQQVALEASGFFGGVWLSTNPLVGSGAGSESASGNMSAAQIGLVLSLSS